MLKLTTPLVQRRVQVSNDTLRLERKLARLKSKHRRFIGKASLISVDIATLEEQIRDNKVLIDRMVELEDKLSTNKPTKTTTKTTAKE